MLEAKKQTTTSTRSDTGSRSDFELGELYAMGIDIGYLRDLQDDSGAERAAAGAERAREMDQAHRLAYARQSALRDLLCTQPAKTYYDAVAQLLEALRLLDLIEDLNIDADGLQTMHRKIRRVVLSTLGVIFAEHNHNWVALAGDDYLHDVCTAFPDSVVGRAAE